MKNVPAMFKLAIFSLLILLQGCGSPKPYYMSLADFTSIKELPYDSPPQVIYRIDDHRFVTLEKYRDCHHGEAFYNDTSSGIRKKIGRGKIENYQGRLINADPTGMSVVLPLSYPHLISCGDRGCAVYLLYSTDGGRKFAVLNYMPHSFSPFKDTKEYTIIITKDMLYVGDDGGDENGDLYVKEYPLHRQDDPSDPRSRGKDLVTFMASTRPGFLSKFRTPSGQDRIQCDASIKPTNPNVRLAP
ncbi:MAG: hypothetical protein V4764_09550 [Burkholderia sp.]